MIEAKTDIQGDIHKYPALCPISQKTEKLKSYKRRKENASRLPRLPGISQICLFKPPGVLHTNCPPDIFPTAFMLALQLRRITGPLLEKSLPPFSECCLTLKICGDSVASFPERLILKLSFPLHTFLIISIYSICSFVPL